MHCARACFLRLYYSARLPDDGVVWSPGPFLMPTGSLCRPRWLDSRHILAGHVTQHPMNQTTQSINPLCPASISPSSPQALTLASIAGPRSRLISQDFRHSSNVWPSHFRFHPDHTRYSPLLLLPAALAWTALRRGSTYEMGLFHVSPDCHPWLA